MTKHWSGLPFLDVLRPNPGWMVEQAILATYSADLIVVVASLLALAGLDDDRGSGSKVDFANAYERLRDRVHILVQAGQIGSPAKRIPILSILDRFLKEVNHGERGIWHPKLALIKFRPNPEYTDSSWDSQTAWRLWIGSRNLTRSLDWDAGLVLVSQPNGPSIPGIANLGGELANLVGAETLEPTQFRQELEEVGWKNPKGVETRELCLLTPRSQRGLPAPPKDTKRLIVISPFIDGKTIKRLGNWGADGVERTLLSCHGEMARLNAQAGDPLAGFSQLLGLAAPEPEDSSLWSDQGQDETAVTPDDAELQARGLHAKLIFIEHGAGRTLWLGSANATSAGWDGPNTEVVARLDVLGDDVADGINCFIGMAEPLDRTSLAIIDESDPDGELLDEAHRQVAARWRVIQHWRPTGPLLISDRLPHPDHPEMKLEVGLLACDLVSWRRGQWQVQLPPASLAQATELVQVRLGLGDRYRSWLQCTPFQEPIDEERDMRALSQYLDPRTFLLWIRSMLHTEDFGGGGDWDVPPCPRRGSENASGLVWWAPTLEEILKAWSRDPSSLNAIDRRIERFLGYMHDRRAQQQMEEERSDEWRLLEEFQRTWQLLRETLMAEDQ